MEEVMDALPSFQHRARRVIRDGKVGMDLIWRYDLLDIGDADIVGMVGCDHVGVREVLLTREPYIIIGIRRRANSGSVWGDKYGHCIAGTNALALFAGIKGLFASGVTPGSFP